MDIDTAAALLNESVKYVIQSMAMTDVSVVGGPKIKEGNGLFGDVTGIIGLANPKIHASMSLSFEKAVILDIFSNMLGDKFDQINDEVIDAVGELTNMVCGDSKRRLTEKGVVIEMASPLVIAGNSVRIRDRVTRKTWILTFQTSAGKFVLETNLPS